MAFEVAFGGLHTVISGGQTGADQGGLLAAWRLGVRTAGCAAKDYKVQDGHNPLLEVLGLRNEGNYQERTITNVLESDGTVIVAYNVSSPGTVLTIVSCRKHDKPYLVFDVSEIIRYARIGESSTGTEPVMALIVEHAQKLADWIVTNTIGTLNVAGNREIRSNGSSGGTLMITSVTDWIITLALNMLELDDKLVFKEDLKGLLH